MEKKLVAGDYIPLKKSAENIFETTQYCQTGNTIQNGNTQSVGMLYLCYSEKKQMEAVIRCFPIRNRMIRRGQNIHPFAELPVTVYFQEIKVWNPISIGTRDMMAVVVSKDSLDWSGVNAKISQNKTGDYGARLRSALGSTTRFIPADISSKGNIHFKADEDGTVW